MGLKDLFGLGKRKEDQIEERTPFTLHPGDMVDYEGTNYFVTAKYVLNEEGWEWFEYRLDDGEGSEWWLTAEDDDGVAKTSLYEALKGSFDIHPGDKNITFRGIQYTLDEQGTASATKQTKQGEQAGLQCSYWDYISEDETRLLALEKWNDTLEVSLGKPVNEFDYELYPAG